MCLKEEFDCGGFVKSDGSSTMGVNSSDSIAQQYRTQNIDAHK